MCSATGIMKNQILYLQRVLLEDEKQKLKTSSALLSTANPGQSHSRL